MHAPRFIGVIGLLTTLTLVGCGGSNATSAAGGAPTTVEVSADPSGQLKFQPETLSAVAGQPIAVSFKNPSALQHNWVLVTPGQEQAVADATMSTGGDAKGVSGIIATGGILNANGAETIQAPAQPAGTYPYICTIPGHFAAGMKGTLTVK